MITFALIFFTMAYLAIGLLAGAIEVKYSTGKDTWANLWQHRRMVMHWVFFWLWYCLRVFFPKKH